MSRRRGHAREQPHHQRSARPARREERLRIGALQQRLEAFVDWLDVGVGALGSFVADADGLILASRNAPDTYAVATASLAAVAAVLVLTLVATGLCLFRVPADLGLPLSVLLAIGMGWLLSVCTTARRPRNVGM